MLKSFRFILFPFSVIYSLIIRLRNFMYDKKMARSAAFNFPLICVGNLAVGGTGKTPMTEYLIRMLQQRYKIATLSRGYKRKTKGFAIADKSTTAIHIGDEPMQIHTKFPDITVAVCEERIVGIPQLLHQRPDTQVILLDDAFQHRPVSAGLNILLTDYNDLYTRDFMLPAGNLRDSRRSARRADIIIVTKCKPSLNEEERQLVISELHPLKRQKVFFTKIQYSTPYHLFTKENKSIAPKCHVLLVCAIAKPAPLKEVLNNLAATYEMLLYRDHHIFSTDDLKEIIHQFSKIRSNDKMIITTEKDAVRLSKYENELKDLPVYALPMRHEFMFGEENIFKNEITGFIEGYAEPRDSGTASSPHAG
ncbi:MAG TPA: tetraacyldisaccharide 4'-kinase [Chitinophagaceae bacterium]|nr:tetraacyldisaccharide 4'-kinase [Chitinophagaceae bacterium]